MKLFLHFVESSSEALDTCVAQSDSDLTLKELVQLAIIDYRRDILPDRVTIYKVYRTEKLEISDEYVSKHFADGADVFLVYERMKPVLVEQSKKTEVWESIAKYSFSDEETKVSVYIELPGIGDLPKENIQSRFLERSFEVKIRGYLGRNFIFAVPKTQCPLVPEKSKVVQKANRIIIQLGKTGSKDHWYTLYRSKAVGEAEEL